MIRRLFPLLLLLFAIGGHSEARAQAVSLEMANGRLALADYRPGESGRPALLLLHGFLQTHHFAIIQSLADELNDNGYTVLAPTLTLGIDQRRESLPCDAIQTHTLEQGAEELDGWIQWLATRGHPHVVGIGHSSGGARLLLYSANAPHPALDGSILVSLGHFGGWPYPGRSSVERSLAEQRLAAGDRRLVPYHLVFCEGNYLAPPAPFLSYARLDTAALMAALGEAKVPTTLIFGGADRHIPPGWVAQVSSGGIEVHRIEGANHFFSGTHEFDLHDRVLQLLGRFEE